MTHEDIAALRPRRGGSNPTYLASGTFIGGMAVSGGKIYWNTFTGTTAAGQPDPEKSVILSVSVNGGAVTTISSDVRQTTTVAADANGVFFARRTSPSDQIVRAPLSGGTTVPVATGVFLNNIVTDGNSVYFTTGGCTVSAIEYSSSLAGRIVRAPASGTPSPSSQVVIAGGFQGPRQIAVDQTNVYWLNVPCTGTPSLMKVHK